MEIVSSYSKCKQYLEKGLGDCIEESSKICLNLQKREGMRVQGIYKFIIHNLIEYQFI